MEQDQSYDKDECKVQWNSVYSNLSYWNENLESDLESDIEFALIRMKI